MSRTREVVLDWSRASFLPSRSSTCQSLAAVSLGSSGLNCENTLAGLYYRNVNLYVYLVLKGLTLRGIERAVRHELSVQQHLTNWPEMFTDPGGISSVEVKQLPQFVILFLHDVHRLPPVDP